MEIASFRVRGPGSELACLRFGSGPPLVLAHPLFFSKSYFSAAAEIYGARFNCVVFDQRGHGDTEADGFDFDAMAEDWGAILDARGWARAAIGGTSLGAATALRFALKHPERVSALMQDLPGFGPGSLRPPERTRSLAAAFTAGGLEAGLLRITEGMSPPRAKAWGAALQADWKGYEPARLARNFVRVLEASPDWRVVERWPEDLSRVAAPCCILAVQGDPVHPWETAQTMQAAIPGARLASRVPSLSAAAIASQWIKELES